MPIGYKVNVLGKLKEAGYNTNRLRQEKILGEATIQRLRHYESVSWANIATICKLLNCDIGDILGYYPDEKQE